MKIIRLLSTILVGLSLIFFTACNSEKKNHLVAKSVNELYQISIPEFCDSINNLSSEANFQYGNKEKSFYIIIIEDSIEDFYTTFDNYGLSEYYSRDIKGFVDFTIEKMQVNNGIFNIGELNTVNINNLNSIQTDFSNVFSGLDMYYHYSVIESESSFYQIMMWTLQSNKDEYKEMMKKVSLSFKENN